jgi:acyl carrier protein
MADVRQIVVDIIADIAPDEDVTNLDDKKSLREQLDLDSNGSLSADELYSVLSRVDT